MRRIRIGVVGAGYMGTLHVSKLAELDLSGDSVSLRGIVDIKPERAELVSQRFGVPAYEDLVPLLSEVDALVVAVPTADHFTVVDQALRSGVDVLVEKPIAASVEEAASLIETARRNRCVLQVGHLEWFNSAMDVIRDHFRRPRYAEAQRIGPMPDRLIDLDVIRDLMIHDLDILQQLLGDEPVEVEAVGTPVLTPNVDIANARLLYPCGCVANLTASRVSSHSARTIRFFEPETTVEVDFLRQAGSVTRRIPRALGVAPEIQEQAIDVIPGDALLEQLHAFVDSIRGRTRPRVDGQSGLGALRTAIRVRQAIDESLSGIRASADWPAARPLMPEAIRSLETAEPEE